MPGIGPLTALETVLAWVAHASWQAAVLGLLVLLVSRALRRWLEPRWRFGLWLVVLARLALPITPPAPWSLFRLAPLTSAGPATDGPVAAPVVEPVPARSESVGADTTGASGKAATEVSPRRFVPSEPRRDEPGATLGNARHWLAAAWLAALLVLLARQGWLHGHLRRQRRMWREISDPLIRDAFRRCQEELSVARPVRLLSAREGPAVCGAFRASILLPESLLPLAPDELRLVLLHELMHVRRWDVLLERVAALLVAVHWFNPVAWLALACLRREREVACDAAVLRHLGGRGSGPYGRVLLKVANRLSSAAPLPGAVGIFGKDRSLVRRIHMIAHYRRPRAVGTALGGLLLLGLGAFGLTDAAEPPPKAGAVQTPPAARGEDAKTVAIAGVCQDEEGKPLSGVQVILYREDHGELKVERLRAGMTDDDGHFQFRELRPLPAEEDRLTWGYALVLTKQGRGSIIQSCMGSGLKDPLQFKLRPAATLRGRVTGPDGKPVAGAQVWANGLVTGPVEGVCSTRTDADGRYAITDMAAWGADVLKPRQEGKGAYSAVVGCYFDVLHPDYGHKRPMYRRMPDSVDVVLQPAGVIEGKAVDQVTGKPAAGVLVSMQGTKEVEGGGWRQTRTDADGEYRIPSLVAGKYNLWAEAPDRACAALDSFAVEAGKTQTAPDLSLIEGGWIEGRLIDAQMGKPISGAIKEGCLQVGLYGPSRPKSGAACQASAVDDQGRFRLRVAPGLNFPYLVQGDYWKRTQRREYFQAGVEVKSGEVVSLVFRILPTEPIPDPEPTPVRLPVPVPAERQAAALVRQLGGWYEVDADNHVVEVNMVYHETSDGRRYDNDRTDTDEALQAVSAFPRLKRLFLHKGQATDAGLRGLAGLSDLEALVVWDAVGITDAGVGHLVGLTKLKELDLSNGQLGDSSLAVFGRMTGLTSLGLQGNSFSDDGLKHLAGLKDLRSLYVGMSRRPITDAGARCLAGLTRLEHLDLQGARLTDEGVAALKELKQLRTLDLNGPAISDASVEYLLGMPKLQRLSIANTGLTQQGVERVLALPDLKTFILPSATLPQERRSELQQRRPGLQFIFTAP